MATRRLEFPRFGGGAGAAVPRPLRQRLSGDDLLRRGLLMGLGLWLVVTVLLPLYAVLAKSVEAPDGSFAGLANFRRFAADPALAGAVGNSLWISALSTVICVGLAFLYAYGLTRTRMPGRSLFKAVAQVPILAPSLLPAISLVYLFGNQGLAKGLLMGASIYGPVGIVMGEVFWTFPTPSSSSPPR